MVAFDGVEVVYKEKIYLLLHKPPGVISATEDSKERTVLDLLEDGDRILSPFPVGRLDKDTEGLLLLTNDGQLAHELLSRKHVPKTYEALVEGDDLVGEEDVLLFSKGVELDDGYVTLPAELDILGELIETSSSAEAGRRVTRIRLTIHEGKFHQVKRMFQATGRKVVYLKRISMGSLHLDPQLKLGEYRELTEQELEGLTGNSDIEL